MYLDAKRISILIVLIVFGFGCRWIYLSFKGDPDERIQSFDGEVAWSTNLGRKARDDFKKAIRQSMVRLRMRAYASAALAVYHAYPTFETYLNSYGTRELDDETLRTWFDREKQPLIEAIRSATPEIIEQVKEGRITPAEMEDFINHMPFHFIKGSQTTFRQSRNAIVEARIQNAPGWYLVKITGSTGNVTPYIESIEEALQARWVKNEEFKLVFGGSMSSREQDAAGKFLDVSVGEKFVTYEFEGADKIRGSGQIAEEVMVTFREGTRRNPAPSTTWDSLSEITVHSPAPETLKFRFEHKRQGADFDNVAQTQREKLLTELKTALKSLPKFARN